MVKRNISAAWLIFFVVALTPPVKASVNRTDHVRPIAVSNLTYSELPAGVEFGKFIEVTSGDDANAPAVNNAGQTVFFADLTGPGVDQSNNGSLWLDDNGQLQLLAREGQPAPGAPNGLSFVEVRTKFPMIGDDGTIVFGAALRDASQEISTGIWTAKNGIVQLLALEDEPLPADPTFRVDAVVDAYRVNNVGQIAIWLRGTPTSTGVRKDGIYLFDNSTSVKPIVESGVPAPGIGANYRNIEQDSFALNDAGFVSYVATVEASGMGVHSDSGIWLASTRAKRLLIREGDAAPGVQAGTIFEDISQGTPFGDPITFNQHEKVTFRGRLAGPTLTNRFGVWTISVQDIERRLLEYDNHLADDTNVGVGAIEFGSSKPPISMNEPGEIAYVASLFGDVTDDSDLAVLRDRGQGIELVARTGDHPPGAPEDDVWYSFGTLPSGLGLNAAGQIAFLGVYRNPTNFEHRSGIWAHDPTGNLQLIISSGDTINVAPGDSRVVQSLRFLPGSGNADGQRSGFDDYGRLAFFATFTDGSEGMFYSNLAAVPEPGSCGLLLAASLAVFCRPRPCQSATQC